MNDLYFDIILCVIALLGMIITRYLIPYFKSKISADKLTTYATWASWVVECAEMLWTETGKGKTKKAYAVDVLDRMFNSKKEILTQEQIEILIESAVKQMNQ